MPPIVIGVLTVSIFYFCKDIILPFCLAVFLSFILNPLVRRLERLRIPRVPAVITIVAAACLTLGSAGWLVTNQIIELGGMLPNYKVNLITKVRAIKGATGGQLDKAKEAITEIGEELTEADKSNQQPPDRVSSDSGIWQRFFSRASEGSKAKADAVEVKVVSLPPSPLGQVQAWLGPLIAPLTTAGIVIVLTLFMLIKREDMRTRLLQLVGTAHLHATTEAFDEATQRISSLMRMQLIVNATYGACVGTGLFLIGVPNAILWGALGLVLRFLPYVGPWIVAVLPITLSLAVFDDWTHVIMTVGLFAVLELLVNNVLEPWLYGASTGVSSVGIIVAAIFWTWLWGPIGLVLAMPFTVCLVVAGKYVNQLRFITLLLGDTVSMSPEQRLYQRLLALDDEEADAIISDAVEMRTREEVFNDLLIPTFRLVERDRHAGMLTQRQEDSIFETLREAVEDYTRNTLADAEKDCVSGEVLCVPARDDADEITGRMLGALLGDAGIPCTTQSVHTLASEVVAQAGSALGIVISALPPGAFRHVRYLCKRLRAAHPDLPIVVGLWGTKSTQRTVKRLEDAGATHVTANLNDCQEKMRSLLRLDSGRTQLSSAASCDSEDGPQTQPRPNSADERIGTHPPI